MQTQVLAVQLELDLWQDLKTAKDEPETADILQLWQDLEQVIEQSELDQQLRVAGDAIASIVEVYAIRANAILSSLEVHNTKTEPILSEGFLNDLMRQAMTIDLSDMMEERFPSEPEPQALAPNRGSLAVPIDKKAALAIAKAAIFDPKRILAELAGDEQVSHWSAAIAQWMQQRHDDGGTTNDAKIDQPCFGIYWLVGGIFDPCWSILDRFMLGAVSLLGLQQALGMPLVNIWLGLLLKPVHQYNLETDGPFYSNAGGIFLRHT